MTRSLRDRPDTYSTAFYEERTGLSFPNSRCSNLRGPPPARKAAARSLTRRGSGSGEQPHASRGLRPVHGGGPGDRRTRPRGPGHCRPPDAVGARSRDNRQLAPFRWAHNPAADDGHRPEPEGAPPHTFTAPPVLVGAPPQNIAPPPSGTMCRRVAGTFRRGSTMVRCGSPMFSGGSPMARRVAPMGRRGATSSIAARWRNAMGAVGSAPCR